MTKIDATSETNEQLAFWMEPPKLEPRSVCGSVDVRVGGLSIASYKANDKASRNIAIVSVADGGYFQAKQIAAAFGIAESRVAQIRARYRDGGAALLLAPTGVKGSRTLSAGDIARARAARRAGVSIPEIVAKLNRNGRRTSRSAVGRHVKGLGATTGDLQLSEPVASVEATPLAAGEGAEPAPVSQTAIVVPEGTRQCTVAGAMVAHAALQALGLARAPEIRTVRRKLEEIGSEPTLFNETDYIRDLARTLLREAPAPEGVYFFDGHFKACHGKQPVAKGWDAKRRIGAPGIEDVYVHDLKGRALLFVPLPAPTSLSRAMPLALRELRAVAPTAPSLAVFDRGGWSGDLFRSLVQPTGGETRIDFLTYLKARGKRRELPLDAFTKVSYDDERGRRHTCEIAERTLEMKGLDAPLRLIVLLDRKKGKQIPILTSVEGIEAAKLVHLLRARWRQENSFKYLVGELSIDALVSRDMMLVPDDREVANPERDALKVELAEAERALAGAERAIADAVAQNLESQRRTMRGFKIANAELTRARDEHAAWVAAIREEIAALPSKRRRNEIEPGATIAKPTTKRRVFVNGLKLLAHDAEKWLADRLPPGPYRSHALPILRALFQQPGRITFAAGRVRVEIRPLDTPRYQACVAALLEKLNAEGVAFLDSGRPIEFSVASSAGTTHL